MRIENINGEDFRKIPKLFEDRISQRLIEEVLLHCINNWNFDYNEFELSDNSSMKSFKFLLVKDDKCYINIDYYENTKFFDVEFSYKRFGEEFYRNSLKTHQIEIVLSCLNCISNIINRG